MKPIFKHSIITVLLAAGAVIQPGGAHAAVEVANGCVKNQAAFTLNSPLPESRLYPGGVITVSGRVWQPSSGVGFGQCAKLVFFLAPDAEIPVEDCCGRSGNSCCSADIAECAERDPCTATQTAACGNFAKTAFGSLGKKGCAGQAPLTEEVKFLNPGKGTPIHKLGELQTQSSSRAVNAGDYEIEFSQKLDLPVNLGFTGRARFYVQYIGIGAGTGTAPSWQWLAAYQPVSVVSEEEADGDISAPERGKGVILPNPAKQTDYCTTQSGPAAILSWTWRASGGEKQAAYRIQAGAGTDFSRPSIDSGRIPSSNGSYATPIGSLDFNKRYNWRIKVWDSNGAESSWTYGPAFSTPLHAYPKIKFNWLPKTPGQNEKVSVTDESLVFGKAGKSKWEWTFEGGNPERSAEQNPKVLFAAKGIKTISLKITDSDGYTCQSSRFIQINATLPQWE